jgi:Reverse transcriptase (RNA-dependent DNA polymerase)
LEDWKSLKAGILPASQKSAIITLILKKAGLDVDDVKSYRPISNLTFVSKVIKRIVAKQIKDFQTDSDLMPLIQSAYWPGHATETATVKVLSDILDATDSQKTAVLLGLLDMSAAFDTVEFEILLSRLETSYCLSGTVPKWLTSFVTGRTQAVAFDGNSSPQVKLICSVPQGSVQGPLLFVL